MMRRMTKGSTKPRRAPARAGDISLTDRAYRKLEEMIVTLQLAPGAVVSETALSGKLGIGRTPIRMFDPKRTSPSLLSPGDRVRFVVIGADKFAQLEREA